MPLRLSGTPLPMVGRVRMYVCGITPYDVTHLGHAATYIWADTADRVLRWHGHTVTMARNVTDVDDALFAEARRRGESFSMLATLQRASFEATMARLRVRNPDHAPTAAQAVGHVIQLGAALLARDAAYLRGGTVYARTSSTATAAGLDLGGAAGDFCLSAPAAGIAGGRIVGRAVDRDTGIAAQVERLHGTRHRPDPQLSVGQLDLAAADPGRAVTAEGGDREVLARSKKRAHAQSELRLRLLELGPRRHGR